MFITLSCKKNAEFSVDKITIPKYYHKYNERIFWKSQGVKYYHPSQSYDSIGQYKDTISLNFLTVQERFSGLLHFKEKERINIMKKDFMASIDTTNENYEIYKSENIQSIFGKRIRAFDTYFFIKKDSICLAVQYSTMDNDLNKINDYKQIIKQINRECVKGSTFKSTLKKQEKKREKVIIN